jgi:hypothetical protein
VRRVRQGKTWHPATDDLRGTEVYGSYGPPSSDSTFSVAWQGLGTELLLTTGTSVHLCVVLDNQSQLLFCCRRRLELVGAHGHIDFEDRKQ